VLLLTALLSLWNVSSIGNANSFYAASVLSGTQSWKALFFGSLDAGNFITVDKPPLAEWVMGLFCRVFGFGTWQMMVPVAAAGTASVALLYTMVRRSFGYVAATIAALVLALTPITVAISRDNNPDPFLVLLMLLGAAGCLRAIRTGRLAPLVWCGVAIGFAFMAKMLQGYMVLPAFVRVRLRGEVQRGKADPQPGGGRGGAGRVDGLVRAGGRLPGVEGLASVHRRLDGQHLLEPGRRIQRPGPGLRGQ
jgi:4-amino-4-deoxy-L-arabinose transferase-like glycosyltransferase